MYSIYIHTLYWGKHTHWFIARKKEKIWIPIFSQKQKWIYTPKFHVFLWKEGIFVKNIHGKSIFFNSQNSHVCPLFLSLMLDSINIRESLYLHKQLIKGAQQAVTQSNTITDTNYSLKQCKAPGRGNYYLFFIDLVPTNILLAMLGFPLSQKRHADFCFKPSRLFFYAGWYSVTIRCDSEQICSPKRVGVQCESVLDQ